MLYSVAGVAHYIATSYSFKLKLHLICHVLFSSFSALTIFPRQELWGRERSRGGRIGKARSMGKSGARPGQATRKGSNQALPRGEGGSGSSRNDPEGE